jgi:hypothetical protein
MAKGPSMLKLLVVALVLCAGITVLACKLAEDADDVAVPRAAASSTGATEGNSGKSGLQVNNFKTRQPKIHPAACGWSVHDQCRLTCTARLAYLN